MIEPRGLFLPSYVLFIQLIRSIKILLFVSLKQKQRL